MTTIAFEDGKPVMRDGQVSTGPQCCCDLDMPPQIRLTLSGAPNAYLHVPAATPFADGIYGYFPPANLVLAKCGRSPALIEVAPPYQGYVYYRAANDITAYVPGAMPTQDCTVTLDLVLQTPGQSYFYDGFAPRAPRIEGGPPPGLAADDSCVDCGGLDVYTFVGATAGATSITVEQPINFVTPTRGVLFIGETRYRYSSVDAVTRTFGGLSPALPDSLSATGALAVATVHVTVNLVKRCVEGIPASVCISAPTKGDASDRSQATATVAALDGVLTNLTLTSAGSGYASAVMQFVRPVAEAQIVDSYGTDAELSVTFAPYGTGENSVNWYVESVSVLSRGSGYSPAATAIIVPQNGTQQQAAPWLAVVVGEDGGIDSVEVTFGGSFSREVAESIEVDVPVVSFCAMKGEGAAAVAVVDEEFESPTFGQIVSITLTSGGSGYDYETNKWWACTVNVGNEYEHDSRLIGDEEFGVGGQYNCCAAVAECFVDGTDRIAPCPKTLLNRSYGMLYFWEAPNGLSTFHCSEDVFNVSTPSLCDLGRVNACREETLSESGFTRTAVGPPLRGITCTLSPIQSFPLECYERLEPDCLGQCPEGGTPLDDLVSLSFSAAGCDGQGGTGAAFAACGGIVSATVIDGGSGYATLASTSEPTLTLTVPGGTGAVLEVDGYFARTGDDVGYYGISSVSVAEGGAGYTDNTPVEIVLGEGDKQRFSTPIPIIIARTVGPPPDEWVLTDNQYPNPPSGGSGLVISMTLELTFPGSQEWRPTGVSIVAGGTGYAVGELFGVQSAAGTTLYEAGIEIAAVGTGGEVLSLELAYEGIFESLDTGEIRSIEFGGGGWKGSYRKEVIEVCDVQVDISQTSPSDGDGAEIAAVVEKNASHPDFGKVVGLTVVNGGSGYVSLCERTRGVNDCADCPELELPESAVCGNPFP